MRVDKTKWKSGTIDEYCIIQLGTRIVRKDVDEGEFPVYGGGDATFTTSTYNRENAILISRFAMSKECTRFIQGKFFLNDSGLTIIPKGNRLLFHYLKWHIFAINDKIYSLGKGVAQKNLDMKRFPFLLLNIPPIDEQQAIASELDAIQKIIEDYKAQLADLDVLAQSIFLDTFGDPVSNSKGWEKKTLNEICSKITDGTHDTPKRLTEGIKFITGKHIRPFFIDYDHSDYVSENVHKEIYARCNPQKGDVLYTNIGSGVGTAAVNTVNYEFSMKNVALLKPSKELNGIYLQFALNDIHFKNVVLPTYLAGGAQSFLSLKQIKSMLIPLPNFVLQQQFAEQVEAIERQKELIRQQLADAETLMAERMQYYFS